MNRTSGRVPGDAFRCPRDGGNLTRSERATRSGSILPIWEMISSVTHSRTPKMRPFFAIKPTVSGRSGSPKAR